MVDGAVSLARMVGVSELVIAITLVAFGTSLPELVASISAAHHRETDLAIGNVVGSNIANLLLILGATAFMQPIEVNRAEVLLEFVVMLAFAVLLIPFMRHQRLGRRQSAIFWARISLSSFIPSRLAAQTLCRAESMNLADAPFLWHHS